MPVAYVLLNTEIGAEREVLKMLRKTDGVQEAFGLVGIYDIIARVSADTMDGLVRIINDKVHVRKVHSKLTVIVTEVNNEKMPLLLPAT